MKQMRVLRWIASVALFFCILALMPLPARAAAMSIRVGVKCKCPPYQFLDESGAPVGLNIDIMEKISKLQNLLVTYVVYDTNAEAEKALRRGEIDALLGVQPGAQSTGLAYSNAISSGTVALITTGGLAEKVTAEGAGTDRFSVAYELGTMEYSQVAELHSKLTVASGDQIQLFNHLTAHTVEAVAGVKESILYQAQNSGSEIDELVLVNNDMGRVRYVISIRSGSLMLYNRLEQGISQLRNSDEYNSLVEKWITDENLQDALLRIQKLLRAIVLIVVVALSGLLVFNLWNRQLKQMVRRQTAEIRSQMTRLEDAGRLQKLLIEGAPNSILMLRQDGMVLLMNPRAELIAKREPLSWDAPGREAVNVCTLRVFGQIWDATRNCSGSMTSSAIVPVTLPDGQERQYRYQYYPLNQQGDSVLLAEDVTQEENRRQEIFEANKNQVLNRLIAGIAHEIKNPLMAIQAFASVMREQGGDPEFQESFTQYVPQEVDRINRLVESLINYAKPARGVRERTEVQNLIRESVYLISASAKNRKIRFLCQGDTKAKICVDRDQIKQALLNLLLNSMESVEERLAGDPATNRTITVSAGGGQGTVSICVRDEGMGMSEESVRNCVEPFYTTKKSGTGMGLALAKQYVSENGGRFQISSEQNQFTEISILFKEDTEQ